jgi:hypothetical protein
MSDIEKNWWDDKTIQIPKFLSLPEFCGEEVGVYFKMKSFGIDARSSLKALAIRLDWTEERARKWQRSLWEKRAIVLLVEGRGLVDGDKGQPRQWWMCSNQGEMPPQEIIERVCKTLTLPSQAWDLSKPLENEAPLKALPEANKIPQANKDLIKQANKEKQDNFWKWAKKLWKDKFPDAPDLGWPVGGTFNKNLATALDRIEVEELLKRWGNMLNDPWVQPSLRSFVFDPDKWVNRRMAGSSQPRKFHTPEPDQEWSPNDTK